MAAKIYYSMGEVTEMLDVSAATLRFWEQKFDIIAPHKNKKGNRMFSPEDVRNLKTIYHLVKERGMTLAGAQKHLKANRGAIERDMEIAERLHSIRALLLEVRQELGGEGTVVDDAIEEGAAPKTKPVPETVSAKEPEPIQEQEPAAEPEHAASEQAEPPKPAYREQTLF